ncbi:hypothetical protein [Trinickia mobilis]|uniref:hypothetical protein n=1 Tax=Trinickia mobilis TaxID=2816356 RepID=UPI001A8DC1F7|nr:hypothetical protein [Trinickia mobilis]
MTCLYYTNDAIQEHHHASRQQAPAGAAAPKPAAPEQPLDVVALARGVGMLVTLDGRIGNAQYQSVFGSLSSLERFAQAVRESAAA